MKRQPKNIVVIGAGLGGLAASIQLAVRGHRVQIHEKNPVPGGKIQEIIMNGFRFDAGPGLLTLPELLADLFRISGERMDDHLTLTEPDPRCRYFFPGGRVFDNFREASKNVDQIKEFAPGDAASWTRFLSYSAELYDRTREPFLSNPLYQWSDLKGLNLTDSLKIDAFTTVSKRVDSYFGSSELRQFFKRFATYNGSSPWQAPATLNVIPHVEIVKGGYYVRGGIYRIVKALEKIALKAGVQITCNSDVRKIEIRNRQVQGVELSDGSRVACDLVVSNSDASDTLLNLMDADQISPLHRRRLQKLEPSSSGFVLLLGTSRQWSRLHHHNVFFSSDYEEEFRQIFRENKLPEDPTIYVTNTSFSDPEHAPAGGSNLFVLVNAPWLSDGGSLADERQSNDGSLADERRSNDGSLADERPADGGMVADEQPSNDQDWDTLKKTYTEQILQKLEERGLKGLSKSVEALKVLTPADFQQQFRANRGSLYGSSSNSRFSAFRRPANKLRRIQGLYLVGGSTHPGGGIPLVLLSAKNAVELIKRFEE